MRPRDPLRSAAWMAVAIAGGLLASVLVDRTGLEPRFLVTPAASALVLAALFWFQPAEGVGSFLLVSLVALTLQHWLHLDLRLLDEMTVASFGAVGLVRHGFPNGRFHIGIKEGALAVFIVTGVASSLVALVPVSTWVPALVLVLKAIALFYVVSWLRLTAVDVQRVGLVIVSVALLIAALGFVELVSPTGFQRALDLPPFTSIRGDLPVVKSIFLQPALLAWLTVFLRLLLYARFIVTRRWWLLPIALALNVLTIFTGRRTSLIGVVVALLVAAIWQLRHVPNLGKALGVWIPVVTGLAIVAVVFLSSFSTLFDDSLREYSAPPQLIADVLGPHPNADAIAAMPPRIALYVASVAIARDEFPFGAGLGRFGSEMSRVAYSPVYERYGLTKVRGLAADDSGSITDTFWPTILGETGVVGLGAFGLFIAALLAELWRFARGSWPPQVATLALVALLVFAESIVASLTSQVFVAPPIAYFVFGVAGAACAVQAGLLHPPPVASGAAA